MSLLRVERLSKHFGGYQALSAVSFALEAGELLGLIGPNGAGKTTLFHLVTGFLPPSSGRVWFRDRDITALSAPQRAQLGIVRTFQKTSLFAGFTVADNLLLASHKAEPGGLRRTLFGLPHHERTALEARVTDTLELVGLRDKRDVPAVDLPYGDQRILEIAIAVAAQPTLLLVDEPVAGMNPTEATACMALLRRIITERGATVLLVEHNMSVVMGHSDRVVVLDHGEKLAEGVASEIQNDPKVIEAYLGSDEPAGA